MKKRLIAILMICSLFWGQTPTALLEVNAAAEKTTVQTYADTQEATEIYLSDLEWDSQSCGGSSDFPNGTAKDTAVNGETMRLKVNGQETTFEKGLGAHAPSEIVYDIEGRECTRFEAYAGVDLQTLNDYNNAREGIIGNFVVEIDGVQVAESGEMNPSMDAYHFDVTVPEGAEKITLKALTGENAYSDWIIWADAKITALPQSAVQQPAGPTIEAISGNNITLHVVEGELNLYRGDTLVAKSSSLGAVNIDGTTISDFIISDYEIQENVETERGTATRLVLEMTSKKANITKVVWYDLLKDIDGAIYTTTFLTSEEAVTLSEVVENEFTLVEPDASRIWSYNGGGEGTQSWYDTLQKVSNSFYRENKQDDTSAAIPVADIYSVNGGITVGDGAVYRRFLTTPVKGEKDTATVSIHWKNKSLAAGEMTEAGTSIVAVHSGDYYCGLRTYADVMSAQGFSTPETISAINYDLRWESWGWEGAWTIDKILGKLDELYEQGVRQITLDDCWYTSPGDWELNPEKFPNGTEDMKRLTDAIHEKGMTIVIWWRPMDGGRDTAFSVLTGFTQQPSNLLEEHPEYFVKNEDGSFAKLSGPGSSNAFNGSTGYALCPYSEGAVESQKAFIRRAMTEWGIDGFKSDYVWGMPKCYDETHNHQYPEESTEMASEIFYKAIYEEMISINPDSFHLLCNCGTPQDYYSFPYVTQIPTADPTSVDQTRRRVKAYKALAGDDFPITTDHNEIWYPSSVGTGAVLIEKRDFTDESAQEEEYYKWLAIAEEHQLHKGTHIGDLYAYGIDSYETYVIEKNDMLYYSFYKDGSKYAPEGNPEVELKGLNPERKYRIEDYVNDRVIAEEVYGRNAIFTETFDSYLLLRAIPLDSPRESLHEAIAEAEALAQTMTASSAKALIEKIKEAKKIAETGTLIEVESMIAELTKTAEDNSSFVPRGNTESLSATVETYKGFSKEAYTEESWAEFEKKLNAAKAIIADNSETTQADVNQAKAELQAAAAKLVKRSEVQVPTPTIPVAIAKEDVVLAVTSMNYTGKALTPSVTVKAGSVTLAAGTDYTVTYQNNKNIGTASVVITGTGNYTGTITKAFTIVAKKGTKFTVGGNKYKITSASTVSFTGLKKSNTKNVKIPGTVKIGGKTFKVTAIANRALKNKKKVTSVTIGNNVKTIGTSAFEGCTKLSKVTIGKKVTKIGAKAFKGCKALKSITIKSTKLKKVQKNAFKGIKSNAKIKVPSKRLKAYKKLLKNKGQSSKVKITK